MRVFISFARDDADLAAQLEAALRRNNIETWSSLDVPSGEDWKQLIDREGASADGYIFLLGEKTSVNAQLQAEWRSFLRNDWELKKPLIPVIYAHGPAPYRELPPFLRHRRAIFTTNFDAMAGELRYLVENPTETLDRTHERESRSEQEERLAQLKEYAQFLKEESATGGTKPQ